MDARCEHNPEKNRALKGRRVPRPCLIQADVLAASTPLRGVGFALTRLRAPTRSRYRGTRGEGVAKAGVTAQIAPGFWVPRKTARI